MTVARFPSKCPSCGGQIDVGDAIVPQEAAQGAQPWVHEVCPPAKFDIRREVCPVCFTEVSVTGACMCPGVA